MHKVTIDSLRFSILTPSSAVPVGQGVAACPVLEGARLCHTDPALPLDTRAAPGAQDPAEAGQLHPRNGGKMSTTPLGLRDVTGVSF